MPNQIRISWSQLTSWFKANAGTVTFAVFTALLTAILTYVVTAQLNTNSAVQQQNLAALQRFVETGSQVDASVTELTDAVADVEGLSTAKKDVRRSLAAHAAASQDLKVVVGKANIDAYLDGMGTLRDLVDHVDDPREAFKASQARFDVMHNRTVIVSEARKNIYS